MDLNKQARDFNLVTYYLLPLIYLNKFSFGPNNFVNSFVTEDGAMLVVKIRDPNKVYPKVWLSDYMIKEDDNGTTLFFELPNKWYQEFLRFVHGRYSWFSDKAIDILRKHSGLHWQVRSEHLGQVVYLVDIRLKALTRDEDLRKRIEWEKEILLDDEDELLDPPDAAEYWK